MRPKAAPALLLPILLLCLSSCFPSDKGGEETLPDPAVRDWAAIVLSDTLVAGTVTSPTDFYIYRDEKFGAEYLKARSFAHDKGLELDIRITQSPDTLRQWVESGEVDLSITPFAKSKENDELFAFLGMTDTLSLVLVQAKSGQSVRSLHELHRHTLTVISNSVYELRARQIAEELGDTTVHIASVDTLGQEDLLENIAASRDPSLLTLAESDLARIYAKQFPGLDISVRASLPIRYSWITRKDNSSLRDTLDAYFGDSLRLSHFRRLALLDTAHKYYFAPPAAHYELLPGAISAYDELFKKEAARLGWHWTLLAAIAAQESTFRAGVVGWSGARGLMGIMPSTGRHYGASPEELLDPAVSVRVSTDILLSLKPIYRNLEGGEENREAFVLAAYNAGVGHVQDAQRLAKKYGADPGSWYGGVREYMLLKSNPKYYNDPVVKFGYVRGRETVDYVDKVLQRASAYRQHIR